MSTISDKKQHYKTIDKTCYTANTLYLFLHVLYLIFFIISKFTALIIVDAVVVAIDVLFYLLIKKKKYYLYALLCGNMYFAFVSVTTIMLGFASGFHLYLIGLCVVSFFTSYFSTRKDIKGSIIWVGLSLAIYLTLYLVTKFNDPYYHMENWLEITLFSIHAVVVFAFIAAYMIVFLKYALSLEKRIMSESRTDELTQISNRYGLYDFFDEEEDKTNKVLALFDIDDFKNINDTYGHVTGDFILKRVAEIATNVLSDSFICRYGGEEFVAVLKDDENHSFYEKLEELRNVIKNETFEFEKNTIKITITIGAINYLDDISIEEWVELADEKMYSGKKTGKNKTVL